jgi:hypothetical protein
MDLLRSCYKRRFRYVAGDLTKYAIATWYFAHPLATVFPAPHKFGSAVWDSDKGNDLPLGDDATVKSTWYNGRNPNRSFGLNFAGPLSFFQDGASAPAVLPRASDGTPLECLPGILGEAIGGSGIQANANYSQVRKGASIIDLGRNFAGIKKGAHT